jgi:hypothetical protein
MQNKLQKVSAIKALLSQELERVRAKVASRGILGCVPKVEPLQNENVISDSVMNLMRHLHTVRPP